MGQQRNLCHHIKNTCKITASSLLSSLGAPLLSSLVGQHHKHPWALPYLFLGVGQQLRVEARVIRLCARRGLHIDQQNLNLISLASVLRGASAISQPPQAGVKTRALGPHDAGFEGQFSLSQSRPSYNPSPVVAQQAGSSGLPWISRSGGVVVYTRKDM